MERQPFGRPDTTPRMWAPLLIATAAWLAAACGDPPVTPPDPVVATVVVTPANSTLVSFGETLQLTATPQTSDGGPVPGKTATWSSSDATIATVSDQGLATAVANGSATISATIDGITGDATVLVVQAIAGVEVTATTDTITTLGGMLQLTAAAVDARDNEVAGAVLTWSSSDETIATVSNSGEVTSVANGTVTITAMSGGLEGTVQLIVFTNEGVVNPAGSVITVNGAQVILDFPAGAVTQTLTVTVDAASPNPATNRAVAGTAFVFGPDGTTFDQPVTLTIAYDPSDLPSGTEEAGLGLYRAVADNWELVSNSAVDVANDVASGTITSFSAYAVLDGPRPDALVFTEFPAQSVVAGDAIPPLVVHMLDDLGNLATRPADQVGVFLELLGEGSGSIEGLTNVPTVDGIATFEGLSITEAGSYQIIASADPLVPDSIDVEVTDVTPTLLIAFLRKISDGDDEFDVLSLLDPTSGSVNDALVLQRSSVNDPSWAPARDRIVFEDANCGFFFDEFLQETVESCAPPDNLKILDLATSTTTTICTGMDLVRCPETPSWAPAGDEIAVQGRDGNQVVVLDAMGGVVHTFAMPGAWGCGPGSGNSCVGAVTWRPDAKAIAFECTPGVGMETTLCVVFISDGGVVVVRPAGGKDIANPAWSPDGQWIAYDLDGEGIEMLLCTTGPINCSLSSGGPGQFPGSSIVPLGSFEEVSEPSWSPDGSQIVFTCERPDSEKKLCLVEFATGEVTELGVLGKSPAWNN